LLAGRIDFLDLCSDGANTAFNRSDDRIEVSREACDELVSISLGIRYQAIRRRAI
jgi:hypothetical protein